MTSGLSARDAARLLERGPVSVLDGAGGVSPAAPRRSAARRLAAVAAAVAGVLLATAAWRQRADALGILGAALVREDAVAHADVAIVSMAQPRAAALDAAKLYRRGLVREVWIPRWRDEPADRRVDDLGLRVPRHHEVARAILERAGVPATAVVVLDDAVDGLESEMAAVGRRLRAAPATRPVVVTQRSHTARARLLLRDVHAPQARSLVRAAHGDRFDPSGWWRERGAVREVLLEYAKWVALLVWGPQRR